MKLEKNHKLVLLLLVVIGVPSILIFNYTQNDPTFCTTCHIMIEAHQTWQESPHNEINCHECHRASIQESLGHVYSVLTENPQEVTKPTVIENSYCENCHMSDDPNWIQIAETAGHYLHVYETNAANCTDCHGVSLHIFQPPEEACLECHVVETLHVKDVMMTKCITCHDYLAETDELIPIRQTCLECHPESDLIMIIPGGAHYNSSCGLCHDPHEIDITENCGDCHSVSEDLHSIPVHTVCDSCHVTHSDLTEREICENCHTDKVDHFAPTSCLACHD